MDLVNITVLCPLTLASAGRRVEIRAGLTYACEIFLVLGLFLPNEAFTTLYEKHL